MDMGSPLNSYPASPMKGRPGKFKRSITTADLFEQLITDMKAQ